MGKSDRFVFDTDIVENFVRTMNRSVSDSDEVQDSKRLKGVSRNLAVTKPVAVEENNMKVLASRMDNLSKIMSRGMDEIVQGELELYNIINSIEVPKLNVGKINSANAEFKTIELEKEDGRAITEGVESQEKNYTDGTTYMEQKKLEDITSDKTQEEKVYDETSRIEKESIESIVSDKEQEEKEYDDRSEIQETQLKNIENGINQQQVESSINYDNLEKVELNKAGNQEEIERIS